MKAALALAGILAVHFALYARMRHFDEFVWADSYAIRDSAVFGKPLAQALRTTEHARMNPSLMELHGIELTHEAYRPLLILSHAFDLALFGRASGPMHIHNLILDELAVLLVFWLAARLLSSAAAALWVAAMFAWHPFHVEVIGCLSARADLLAGIFTLLAAILAVEIAPPGQPARGRGAQITLSLGAALSLLLSLFAKEANLLLPLALVGFTLALDRWKQWRSAIFAQIVALPAYALARALLVPHAPAATHASRVFAAIVAFPGIAVEYARSFVLPLDMSISRPQSIPPWWGWPILLLVTALVAYAVRRDRARFALPAAALGFAIVILGPSAVAVLSEGPVADRYAYLPVFGFSLAAVALGMRYRWPRFAVAIFLALCGFVTAREVPAWASDGALFGHAVAVEPDSASAHNRLGRWLGEKGNWPAAATELEKAATLPGAGEHVFNNLGVAYLNLARPAEAAVNFRRGLALSQETSFRLWYNLGTAHRMQGDLALACHDYRRALAISPEYAHARDDLARYCSNY